MTIEFCSDLVTLKTKILTYFLCSSWLCCYMAQMNPLIGPKLHQNTILIMAREWGNKIADADTFVPLHSDEH
jgi:hypothetical protein